MSRLIHPINHYFIQRHQIFFSLVSPESSPRVKRKNLMFMILSYNLKYLWLWQSMISLINTGEIRELIVFTKIKYFIDMLRIKIKICRSSWTLERVYTVGLLNPSLLSSLLKLQARWEDWCKQYLHLPHRLYRKVCLFLEEVSSVRRHCHEL